MSKTFLFIFFYCFSSFTAISAANLDTAVVQDVTYDWFFYDDEASGFLPLADRADFEGRALHFNVNVNNFPNNQLRISSRQEVSIFINNQIVDVVKGERYYDLDSLSSQFSKTLHFTVYHKGLNPYVTAIEILNVNAPQESSLADDIIKVRTQENDFFNDFAIIGVISLFGFLAMLYNYFPKVVTEFFKLGRTLSWRDTDENLFKSRPLSRINLLFYGYLSLLTGLVLILSINYLDVHLKIDIFYPNGFWDCFWKWLQLSGIIACWFFAKYLIIYNMTSLFSLRNFMVPHFLNYIRMTLFIFTAGLVTILFSYYSLEIMSPAYYQRLISFFMILLAIRVVILYIKLMNTGSYKTFHLFSYLCGTEVIPFVILLYLGINQPF